ncbi:hypothetical protein CHS0354_015737 [Potamilus streckersoni]|uniref:C1q domain-containing protein n=1 Tax=Potamilus streckersoni TaxID=2493646 RepID=A0AAE0W693_9BIVA|nr:hypothetical protein CHS0354_015737 [Potamilus streckersoni]
MKLLILIYVLLPIIYDVVRSEPDYTFHKVLDFVENHNTFIFEESKMKDINRPRFKVYTDIPNNNDHVDIKEKDIIEFGVVSENVNGCYNTSTSVFTAPVSGTYIFYLEQTEIRFQYYLVDIVREKNHETLGFIATYNSKVKYDLFAMANLDANEDVWVECVTKNYCSHSGGFYLTFAGILMQEL